MSENQSGAKRHETDDLVITCMDHRFQECVAKRLKDEYDVDVERSDRLSYPGSSKAVADGTLVVPIQTAHRLHGIKNVWVVDHTDCGGFGGLEAYDFDEQKEAEAHFESLQRAKEAIHKVLPQLITNTLLIGLHLKEIKRGVDPRLAPSHQHQV